MRAFSLTELLIVIAIIVILAAITFPVMVRAKARAKQTTCMSNLRQMALRHQIEGSRGGDSPCPLSDQFDIPYYGIPNRKLAEDLELADPGSGYYVCYLHGKHFGPGTSPADFDGTIVRLRRDGSVHVRKVERGCLNGVPVRPDWRLFTDAPCPPEYCSPEIKPCE